MAISRRSLLVRGLGLVGVGGAVAACEPAPFTCRSTVGLSSEELAARTKLVYVARAPQHERACDRCVQYVESSAGGCGTCKVLAGPVHPQGTCNVFTARET